MKRIFHSGIAVLALVFSALPSLAEDEYRLVSFGARQNAEVFLNGYPIATFKNDDTLTYNSTLTPYLAKGTNLITLRTSGIPPKAEEYDPRIVRLKLAFGVALENEKELFTLQREMVHSEGRLEESIILNAGPLFELVLRGNVSNVTSVARIDLSNRLSTYQTFTNRSSSLIELVFVTQDVPLDALPWKGNPIEVGEADRTALVAVIEALHGALVRKDAEALNALLQTKNERYALVNGSDVAKEETETREFFAQFWEDSTFSFAPLDKGNLQFVSYSGANLVQATINGQEPIQGQSPQLRFKLPVYLSKLNGQWTIVE